MGYHGFSSFDQVVEHYNKTKPIQGARVSQDLRPIGTRRYWWNRIIKFDENTYGLSDAYYGWYNSYNNNTTTVQTRPLLPILWERKADGDFVTFRNHLNDSCAVSRYQFLEWYSPKDMHFNYGSGNHWIEYKGQEFSLPKVRGAVDYNNKTLEVTVDSKVTFKVAGDTFTRVSTPQPVKTRRLDKELTKKYRPIFNEYWEWASTILPVLGEGMSKGRGEYANQLGSSFWYWSKQTTPQAIREIISNPDHEHRVALAVCMANEVGACSGDRFAEKPDTKEKLRKLLDRVAGLYATELK
jgi:hypothetical protein